MTTYVCNCQITGMMLDMDNSELFNLIESESQLKAKVDEALRVLHQATDHPAPNAVGGGGQAAPVLA